VDGETKSLTPDTKDKKEIKSPKEDRHSKTSTRTYTKSKDKLDPKISTGEIKTSSRDAKGKDVRTLSRSSKIL